MKKLMLIGMLLSSTAFGFDFKADWNAKWIGLTEDSAVNTWLAYRTGVELDSVPKEVIANIACDSKYWLWINGEMAVFEGQLKRGPNSKDTYYDPVDIAPYLKRGENTIAILVWHFGKHGFSHNNSGKAGLIFDTQLFRSDSSWKVIKHPAFGMTGQKHPNFRLPESNVLFDARKDMGDWTAPAFDDTAWQNAVELGTPPCRPWGRLAKRQIPQWLDSGLRKYEKVSKKANKDGSTTVTGKLPYNCHVTPYIKLKSKPGKTIDIRSDNYIVTGNACVRSEYITKNGNQDFETPAWINGHHIHYKIPKGVEVLEVRYRETGYDADVVGMFECENERLNELWQKSFRTLYVTMRDTYFDCPDRERAQWWGDMVNEMGEAFYVFDAVKGPMLAKKGIYELAKWQRDDKVLYSPVPAGVSKPDNRKMKKKDGSWYKELPRQMLASVGWYGFWYYYWYTGDQQTIVDVYPHVRDYLSLWKLGADGLVIHRTGDWDWTDWGKHKDVPVVENAWLYLALKAAVEMAQLSGNTADIADYQASMKSIEANFNKTFWDGKQYRSAAHKGLTDDRGNAMAVVAGLAKSKYYPAIQQVLKQEYNASPYMEKYVLESLFMMGDADQAVERILKRFAKMIDAPISTLYENFGGGEDRANHGTINHAWSGGGLTMMHQYIAGVQPTSPAFKTYSIRPQMGSLKHIRTKVPTQFGTIELELNKTESGVLAMNLNSPKETTATVALPLTEKMNTLTVNGNVVWAGGAKKNCPAGCRFQGVTDNRVRIELAAGKWAIELK
ncbi:MAG: glycoside hydrolase [Rhodospirillales bacterium]|jgi:alpha-L-rhamnosidase|nr:glycoside hydrolase [Rhodospirillales bacterium]